MKGRHQLERLEQGRTSEGKASIRDKVRERARGGVLTWMTEQNTVMATLRLQKLITHASTTVSHQPRVNWRVYLQRGEEGEGREKQVEKELYISQNKDLPLPPPGLYMSLIGSVHAF